MRTLCLSKRTAKEILRDPLNLAFGLGFPLVLLVLLSAIQANIPVPLFEIESLAPGVCVFGLSFVTLFSATLISRDRKSALMERLYTTPLTACDFILSYTLPLLPIAVGQTVICYFASLVFGLDLSVKILLAIILSIPVSGFFISLGLLFGSILGDKQVGGVCGALLTNLSAWLSGTWFDLGLVGGVFEKIANLLPFVHAVEMERAVFSGNYADILPHLIWVLAYTLVAAALSVFVFLRQMKK